MKLKKLNVRGFSHEIGLILFVIIFAIAGVGYVVASHADPIACPGTATTSTNSAACKPLPRPKPSSSGYTYIGQATPSNSDETVSAYACVTKLSNTEWVTTGLFELSSSYKQPTGFNWTASITNRGTTPVPNNQTANQNFVDDATLPAAVVTIFTNPNGENPLTFSYSSGTSIKGSTNTTGSLASNIHPDSLKICSAPPPSS
jgi:hypothetical protein